MSNKTRKSFKEQTRQQKIRTIVVFVVLAAMVLTLVIPAALALS